MFANSIFYKSVIDINWLNLLSHVPVYFESYALWIKYLLEDFMNA